MIATCLALLLSAPGELRVGVVAISGSSDPKARSLATQVLTDALAGVDGVAVVSFANIDAVLGAPAKQALDACADDACVVAATRAIATDRIALGTLDEEAGRSVLRLRLIQTDSAATLARVTRDVSLEEAALRSAVIQSALELVPEQARATSGTLEIGGAIPGARIVVDGRMSASVPLSPVNPDAPAVLRLAPGSHEIQVSAPGHHPTTEKAEVVAGQRTRIEIDLAKNRSTGPYILGGVGVAAGVAGVILGAVAQGQAKDWEEACPPGMPCAPGFTRARYELDEGSIARERTVANVLYGVGGAAVAGAVLWFFFDPGSDL